MGTHGLFCNHQGSSNELRRSQPKSLPISSFPGMDQNQRDGSDAIRHPSVKAVKGRSETCKQSNLSAKEPVGSVCVEGSGDFRGAGQLKPSISPSETSVLITQPCGSLSREAWLLCLARRCSIQKANKPPQLPGLRSPLPAAASKTNNRVLFLSKPRMKSSPIFSHPHADASTPAPDLDGHPKKPIPSFPASPQPFPQPFPASAPRSPPQGLPRAPQRSGRAHRLLGGPTGSGSPGRSAAARMQTPIVHQDAQQLVCSCEAMRVP